MFEYHPFRKMQRDPAHITAARSPRVARGRWFAPFACLSMVAVFLLLFGLNSQAQDSAQEQAKIASQESGFLGDNYSKLQPDAKNSDLLIYWRTPDVLQDSS